MQAYDQLTTWKRIVINSDDEEEWTSQITVSNPVPQREGGRVKPATLDGFLSLEQGKNET